MLILPIQRAEEARFSYEGQCVISGCYNSYLNCSNGNAECATLCDTRSAAAGWLIAARDFCERPSIGCDGVAESLAIDELAFAAAGDEFGLAENLEMVRDSRGGDAAHRDDVTTAYSVGC